MNRKVCQEVCRGAQRCVEVHGGVQRGVQRWTERCMEVHGGGGKKLGFYVN